MLHCIFIPLFIFCVSWHTEYVYSMENLNIRRVTLYFHGYGEAVLKGEEQFKVQFQEDPTTWGRPPDITKSSFYTKNNVINGIIFLKEKINNGYNAFDIIGRSNGGGVLINCLYFLNHYNNHQDYFQDTDITEDDAKGILKAINNGSIHITVPLLSLRNTLLITRLSTLGGYSASIILFYYANKTFGYKVKLIFLLCLIYAMSKVLTPISVTSSDDCIVPRITHYSYDPLHIKPIDAVVFLEQKIKCPLLLHVSKYDGVLKGPNQDTVTVFKHLRKDNEANTFIIVTDDDSHNQLGRQYNTMKNKFDAFCKNQNVMHRQQILDNSGINNVHKLKKEIGWPVLPLSEFTYKKPNIKPRK